MSKSSKKKLGSTPSENYYYAEGKPVSLVPASDLLAIDERALAQSDLSAGVQAAVKKAARPVGHGLLLAERSTMTPAVIDKLEQEGALQPVYRAAGAVLIALPEVRVEEARGVTYRQGVKTWLDKHAEQAAVETEVDGRFTIRPRSGYGGDALSIANALTEEVNPELAQARFVRIVNRPKTRSPGE